MTLIGRLIGGKYQVLAKLGAGGMGTVYQARDISLERLVAIKALNIESEVSPKERERFLREARSLARLEHSNVLQIYELVEEGNAYYMVMQYVSGGTLKDRIQEAWGGENAPGLEPEFIIKVVSQVSHALDYAHNLGIIHRDIKPGNILLTQDEQVLLGDFGIAKWTDVTRDTSLTAEGTSIGTPAYMSPEQINNRPLGPQSDIYSLAIVTYQMLTGQLPFKGDTIQVIHKQLTAPPPPLTELDIDVPAEVEQVLFKALEKDPAKRYSRAGDFAAALQEAFTPITGEVRVAKGGWWERLRESAVWGAFLRRRRRGGAKEGRLAARVAGGILRTLLTILIVTAIIAVLILTGLSVLLARLAENAIARADWELYETYDVTYTEAELSRSISNGIEMTLPGLFESAKVDFKSPDTITLTVNRPNGGGVSFSGDVHLNEQGRPIAAIRRLNKLPLSIWGSILSGGINRGFSRAIEAENASIEAIRITDNSITISVQASNKP